MRPQVFEVAALLSYAGAIAFLYRAIEFLAERDYVAAILCAGVGLAVARLAGDMFRYSLWRSWREERRSSSEVTAEEP